MAGQPDTYIAGVLTFGARDNIAFGATRYLAAVGGTTLSGPTAANELALVVPRGGVLKNLAWGCYRNTLSGGTGTCSVTARVNGASTALEATWALPAQPTGGTGSGEVAVSAGDRVSVLVQAAGTAGNLQKLQVSFELEVDSTSPWWLNGQDVCYDGPGRVAIGTDTPDPDPAVMLTVEGRIKANAGGVEFPDGTVQTTAFGVLGGINALTGAGGTPPDAVYVDGSGRVGIGIGSAREPQERLTLAPGSNAATEMPTPSGVNAAELTSGELAADDYFFRVSASDGTGWTKASPQLGFNLLGGNGIRLSWDPVLGATIYRVYRALTATGPYKYIETAATHFDYQGDSGFTVAGVPPEETTAYVTKLSAAGPSWVKGGNLGLGTARPQFQLHVGEAGNVFNSQGSLVGIYSDRNDKYLEVGSKDQLYFFLSRDQAANSMVFFTNGKSTIFDSPWGGGYSFKTTVMGGTSTDRLTVTQGGNVGIGTSVPGAVLHVHNAGYGFYGFQLSGAAGRSVRLFTEQGGGGIGFQVTTNEANNHETWQAGMAAGDQSFFIAHPGEGPKFWITPSGEVHCFRGLWSGSSQRLKTNIQPIGSALSKVQRLRGVTFDWKEDGKGSIGLIAEEVGEVVPEVVTYEENGTDANGLDYARLVAVLIEAIKEQQQQVAELQAALDSLLAERRLTARRLSPASY